ncbi:MAG TPA: S8 family peptidase, partial [Acidimicrobiales bacterium]|nr:S8 family peptidase [Acidimicrobiales bacterium]
QGDYGAGVGVAVIDTGVSPVHDLSHVVYGPDLSGDGNLVDRYGHGTVMAGIIAGDGADSAGSYTGVAPQSTVVAVKVAGANGAVDVSTVLQGLEWVSAYAGQYGIRVLNLSWGVHSTQDPAYDPIDYAVERLWHQGIVVVTAAGNAGPGPTTIVKPGDDPDVITVGAYDSGSGTIPAWSSRGPTAQGVAKPDLVAPGRTLVATRSFGSTVEGQNPDALVPPSYIKGSGTSQATAVTSGLVALLLAARPDLGPDQVKYLLTQHARQVPGYGPSDEGAGLAQLGPDVLRASAAGAPNQPFAATGTGSLEASRGGVHVQATCNGTPTVIQGEMDVYCDPWDGVSWTGVSWTGVSWTGVSWTGVSWTGVSWTGVSWTGVSWTNASWDGVSWTGGGWDGVSWTGAGWAGGSWAGVSWTGVSWTGVSWTGVSWTSADADQALGTAFWGDHPRAGRHVPGETGGYRAAGA